MEKSSNPMGQKVQPFFGYTEQSGDLGVEIEVEGVGLPKQANGWGVHVENSLRGANGRQINPDEDQPDTPREYVTNGPVTLPELSDRMDYLHGLLTRKDTKVLLTSRASTHFHVNMMHKRFRDVLGFMMVYVAIEPVLLRLCGPERNGNLFCVPCFESWDLPEYLRRWKYALSRGAHYWPGGSGGRGKYSSMNVDPLSRQGSIEVRCFPNDIRPVNIVKWGSWLLNIRDFAEGYSQFDYDGLVDDMYNTPSTVLSRVFGSEPLWGSCSPHSPGQLVEFGVEQAYEIHVVAKDLFTLDLTKPKTKAKQKLLDPEFFDDVVPSPEYDIIEESL